MDDLTAARLQMATSLGFHIVFACIGMTMPWLMVAASRRYHRSGDPVFRELAQAWEAYRDAWRSATVIEAARDAMGDRMQHAQANTWRLLPTAVV